MLKGLRFAAPSALDKVSVLLGRIFRLQRKINLKQQDEFQFVEQSIEKTLRNLYDLVLPDETYILGLQLADRVTGCLNIYITRENASALLLTCILIADWYLNDNSVSLQDYARIGGLEARALAQLQGRLLKILEYRVETEDQPFRDYCERFRQSN